MAEYVKHTGGSVAGKSRKPYDAMVYKDADSGYTIAVDGNGNVIKDIVDGRRWIPELVGRQRGWRIGELLRRWQSEVINGRGRAIFSWDYFGEVEIGLGFAIPVQLSLRCRVRPFLSPVPVTCAQ